MIERAVVLPAIDDECKGRAHEGWRGDIGIPELALIVRYVKRPAGLPRLRHELVGLGWPEDQAQELAAITSRLCELAYTRPMR